MATVRVPLSVAEALPFSTNFPAYVIATGTNFPVSGLRYNDTTQQTAFWTIPIENYGSGNLTLDLEWYAASASSGTCTWETQVAAITPDTDTQDVETKSLATLNFVQDTHLGTTGKRLHKCSVTISNLDSLASGDLLWLKISRDADATNATDTMTGDAVLVGAVLSYSDT